MAQIIIKNGEISSSAGINMPSSLTVSGNVTIGTIEDLFDTFTVNSETTFNENLSGTNAEFTTISASNLNVNGVLTVDGEVDLSSYSNYAYIIYTSSYEKLVASPGLYVSGNLTGSGHASFQEVSGTTAEFTTVTASFTGSGAGLYNLTASGIPGFTNDVRAQFSAGTNITIVNGVISSTATGGTGSGTPGGVDTNIQFNSGSTFSGSNNLIYNYTSDILSGTTAQFTILTSSVVVPNRIDFNTTLATPTQQEGRLFYDTDIDILRVWTEVTGVALNLGKQVAVRCQNDTGTTLNKGTIVQIVSSSISSDTPRINTASYENDAGSAGTLGLTMTSVADGERTYVLLYGILEGIDTSVYYSGEPLYLSSSGLFSNVKPQAPLHDVRIGNVVRHQDNNGSIFVRVQNGYELEELHDVRIVSPQNGDLISYETARSIWVNGTTLSASYSISGNLTVTGSSILTTVTASSINVTGTLSASSAQSIIKSDQGISFRTRDSGTGSFTERMFIGTDDIINVYSSLNTTSLTASAITANVITASVTLTGSTALFTAVTGNRFIAGNGTAAIPSVTFVGDLDTGFYWNGSNGDIGVTNNGSRTFVLGAAGIASNLQGGVFLLPGAGNTAAGPAYAFNTDLDTGMYRPVANNIAFATSGSQRLLITDTEVSISGNLIVTGSVTELSTRKVKINIQNINNQLSNIDKLNPVYYTRLTDNRQEYGFIAEEMKEVYPEFVVGDGINYSKIVSVLVSAVKELKEKVDTQQRQIELLKKINI